MSYLSWNSAYSVGNQTLDGQHQQIIKLINQLLISVDTRTDSKMIADMLDRLTNYAADHFSTEEMLLARYDYPELEAQVEEHIHYRETVARLCVDTLANKQQVPESLLHFLQSWWKDHILVSDMAYKDFLLEKGAIY